MSEQLSKWVIALTMVTVTVVSSNLNWNEKASNGIIESDGRGYYAYLPALFIYNDLNFGFFEEMEQETYFHPTRFYDYRMEAHGKTVNKYFCGTAVAQLPFFLLAHAYASVTHHPADGYAPPYPILISVAALFYLFLGLFFFEKLLKLYGVRPWARSVSILTLVFGTNVFYYTVGEPGMSHIYSFASVTIFLYLAKRFFVEEHTGQVARPVLLGVLLGLIILIRPTNGLVLMVLPFLAADRAVFVNGISKLLKHPARTFPGIIATLTIISIQLIIYKVSTGYFMVYSYGDEGFNFLSPHMVDILFSYKKGLFLYTPVVLLSLISAVVLWRKERFTLLAYFGFFLLLTYVLSSWWNWWYGGSFSSRVYLEYLALLMLPLAVLLNGIRSRLYRGVWVLVLFLLVGICQIQTYQYRYYILHWENTTQESYWNNFLQVNKKAQTL